MLVGDLLPDHRSGDPRVRLEHRVDVAVQSVQGSGLAVDLLPFGRFCRGECLDDGAAADVVLALDRPPGHAAGVAWRIAAYFPLGIVIPLDVFSGIAPHGRPGRRGEVG
jgi:hypothetical protein